MIFPDGVMTEPDAETLVSLMGTLDVIGDLFVADDGSPEGLRMAAAVMRAGADTLQILADRWEAIECPTS